MKREHDSLLYMSGSIKPESFSQLKSCTVNASKIQHAAFGIRTRGWGKQRKKELRKVEISGGGDHLGFKKQ